MNVTDELKPGEIIRLHDRTIWYVDSVTASGAHIFELTGHEAKITTGKRWRDPETGKIGRKTKVVKRHGGYRVIAANAMVEKIDPSKLDQVVLRRRIRMARKEGQAEGNGSAETQGTEEQKTETARATQAYVRTNKTPKEGMRGQGKLVLDAIDAESKDGRPVTIASLVKKIGKFEGSRQDPERVVGFYLSKFKREGLLNVAPSAPAAAEAPAGETAAQA